MPLSSKSSKDDVETIVEKPKEDEEREEEIINEKKEEENNKIKINKINNLDKIKNNKKNNNEEDHKLFYTHLNPQIIDNTKSNNKCNIKELEEIINEDTFNREK